MDKNQKKLLMLSCSKDKHNNKYFLSPVQREDEVVACDKRRITIISGEKRGAYEWNPDFPSSYRTVAPKIPEGGIKIDGKELAQKLRSALEFFGTSFEMRRIRMETTEDFIMFQAVSGDIDKNLKAPAFFLDCEAGGKKNLPHGDIDGRLLLDVAECLDTFELSKEEGLRPFQIKAGNLEHYIMPLRV